MSNDVIVSDVVSFDGVSDYRSKDYRTLCCTEYRLLVVGVAGRYMPYCIVLGHLVSCCCVSDSGVAAVMLQLCLLLMVAVTGYRVG